MPEYREIPEWTAKDFVRFWTKVRIAGPDECWLWTSSITPSGYGEFHIGGREGRAIGAHRLSFAMSNGVNAVTLHVCHTCDNPPCVNPIHLFSGTDQDNVNDCIAKGRAAVGEKMSAALIGNMPRGAEHHNVKLTAEQVRLIRQAYAGGNISWLQLAKQFHVSPSSIQAIIQRRTWKWLD